MLLVLAIGNVFGKKLSTRFLLWYFLKQTSADATIRLIEFLPEVKMSKLMNESFCTN